MNRSDLLADASTRAANDHDALILFPLWCLTLAIVVVMIFWRDLDTVEQAKKHPATWFAMVVLAIGLVSEVLIVVSQ